MATTKGAHDLLVVLDATGSMGDYVLALNKSLPEIISLSALTGCFERIGVIAYRDYCGGELTEWSGWCSPSGAVKGDEIVSQETVLKMAGDIVADWGGDWPEATKTGLARAYENMREDATTIILLYTDAPPHFKSTASDGPNYSKEKNSLSKKDSFSGHGPIFVDWTSAARTLKSGRKKGVVFSIVSHAYVSSYTPYLYLSTMTGGAHFTIDSVTPNIISQLTLGTLLTWMGAGKAVESDETKVGNVKSYRKADDLDKAKNETDMVLNNYLATGHMPANHGSVGHNVENRAISLKDMPSVLKTRGPSVKNFAKRYVDDPTYKILAVDQLRRIINSNVSAVSVNPIFGTLWRTVCNDRTNEARDGLLADFSRQIERIEDDTEKARMKAWLEESYNYKVEIQAEIAKVPENVRFPVVYLDPTAEFGTVGGDDGDDNRPLNKFTRGELLEIGRSCDYRILRRLGKVLTRLTYVEKAEDLPAHIKSAKADKVPQIPMVLADPKHNRRFWKILLHAVLPGTMITARPAAVLAALALRMGIAPLRDAADLELMSFRDNWNTLDIPETWNVGCLGLLLDADRDFERRVAEGVTKRATPESVILKDEDRRLFKTLVDYKLLEFNLKTTLQAKIGWTPEKTKVALGPVVVCRECKFPRSVTIMSSNSICGMCTLQRVCGCSVCAKSENHEERLKANVATDHTSKSTGYWVECSRGQCRAQYVVYNPNALNVRPKCFYCRHEDGKSKHGTAPVVECTKCLNRVIWPEEYRPKNVDLSAFECYACTSNAVTIISQETTAESLRKENGSEWLLRNDGAAIAATFNGRSLFYTASQCDLVNLPDKVEILPVNNESALTLTGKLVRNQTELKAALQGWIGSRRTESGVCSLCFSNVRKADLRRACGRNGCHQLICNGCIKDWYGLNARGRIINIAALSCAFCRRSPAPKTISPFGIAGVGDLRKAVKEAGSWVYAWCNTCGFAKQYVERACAAGAPPEVTSWNCEQCVVQDSKATLVTKACPGCTAMTMKVAGCDHITCPCGVHWCFACGKDTGADGIYPHIASEHGGIYNNVEIDDDEGGWVHYD